MNKGYLLGKLFVFFALIVFTSAVPVTNSNPQMTEVKTEVSDLNTISVDGFLDLSHRDFSELYGKKMNLKERIAFKLMQKKLKSDLRENKINGDSKFDLDDAFDKEVSSFNIGGFVLGFLLGLIGVGLAHIFSRDKAFRRSSWQGLGAWVILLLVIALV